jgi:hypothetical protein
MTKPLAEMTGIGSNEWNRVKCSPRHFHDSTPMADTVQGGKGSLGIKDGRKRGELRIGGWGREECYDIMPHPSSPLYLESFSRGDMSGSREARPEQIGK